MNWLSNPIFRRYYRSRLRPNALVAWLLITVVLTAFTFFLSRLGAMHRGGVLAVDAERMAIFPLMVIQGLILFFLGTGQVAGGITGEADEGVLDYQRLSPLTPLQKMLGYLFGLPVREWLMFFATMPFSLWCFVQGKVPFASWGSVYLIFIASAILYHMTGLTAGLVIRNRRWAFLSSMAMIMLLYTILPQVAKMGLLFFDYLTIWPVLDENLPAMLPRVTGDVVRVMQLFNKKVSLFNLQFSEVVFTLFCQGGMLWALGTMVCRRWRRAESHLLGKSGAALLFVWLQTFLLGNALPLIKDGGVFPSKTFFFASRNNKEYAPDFDEALFVIIAYGVVTMVLLLALVFMITPAADVQLRGIRRARKLALARVPVTSDAASAWLWAMAMLSVGAGAWYVFAERILASDWFPGHVLPWYAVFAFWMVLVNAVMIFHAVSEGWAPKATFLYGLFVGVVPLLLSFVFGVVADGWLTTGVWVGALSPLSGAVMVPMVMIPGADLPIILERAVPRAFWFYQITMLLINVMMWIKLRQRLRHRSAVV